jgi:hypothetical protein
VSSPDHVVAIVFPHVTIEVPHFGLVPEIGHAGVLLINGTNGLTKYYEYGRYDAPGLGIVRNQTIPDVTMDADGTPNRTKLKATFRAISEKSGKKTVINSVMYRTDDQFATGLAYCTGRLAQNSVPTREAYSVLTNNCVTFADSTVKEMVSFVVRLAMPIWNPVPHAYILALQANALITPSATSLDYDYTTDVLS